MVQRTQNQNAAMHLYFTQVAEALDREGHSVNDVVKAIRKAEVRMTPEIVKEVIWKGIQVVMFGKKSTTELTKQEVDKVYEVMNKWLGQEFELHIPFPSSESQQLENLSGQRIGAINNLSESNYPAYTPPKL